MEHSIKYSQAVILAILAILLMAASPSIVRADNTTNKNTGMSKGVGTHDASINSNAAANSSWDAQNNYWRNNYSSRPYFSSSRNYSTYEPAYRYGVDMYNRNPGVRWEDIDQAQLSSGWVRTRGNSSLSWSDAQMATQDAYNRMYENRSSRMGSNTSTGGSSSSMSGSSTPAGNSTMDGGATRGGSAMDSGSSKGASTSGSSTMGNVSPSC